MAYVPIPYPQVLYDGTGLPVTVKTADVAAQLPATFAPVPTTITALMAFPLHLVAQVAVIPQTLALPPVLQPIRTFQKGK